MSKGIATVTAHPTEPSILIVRPPYDPSGDLMSGFAPATYAPARSAYLVHSSSMSALVRWLQRAQVMVIDERPKAPSGRTGPAPEHDCSALGCRDKAVSFKDWVTRNPELADQLRTGAKWNHAVASIINRSTR